MRESIGGLSVMNIFIFFFIIVTFFLIGTIIYYKGFKINSQLINSIEKFEGYNEYSAEDMDRVFNNLGYRKSGNNINCGKAANGDDIRCLGDNGNYEFELTCSVADKNKGGNMVGRNYYITYKVKTYIFIDLPMNLSIRVPITTKSNPIYQFTGYENGVC